MAQTTLNEWFGLYLSKTREIEMFVFKWSQRLHSSTSESRDEGLAKWWEEDRKSKFHACLDEEYREIRNPTATTFTRCAAARLRFASGSGLAAGRDECMG